MQYTIQYNIRFTIQCIEQFKIQYNEQFTMQCIVQSTMQYNTVQLNTMYSL